MLKEQISGDQANKKRRIFQIERKHDQMSGNMKEPGSSE